MMIRITGKNRKIIANVCVPGPTIGRFRRFRSKLHDGMLGVHIVVIQFQTEPHQVRG